jgi:transposase-like protein
VFFQQKRWNRYALPVGNSWRVDETYVKVRGQWVYLYRAVDKEGRTVDFLLSRRRDIGAPNGFSPGPLSNTARRHCLQRTTGIIVEFSSSRPGAARLCRHRDCKASAYQRQSPDDNRVLAFHGQIALQTRIRMLIAFHSVLL